MKIKLNIRYRTLSVLLCCSILAIVLTSLLAFKVLQDTRQVALDTGNELILQAAQSSQEALIHRAQTNLEQTASDKARHIDENLGEIRRNVQILSDIMTQIASHPERYNQRNVSEPDKTDAGIPTAQLLFSSSVKNRQDPLLREEIGYYANIQDYLVQINAHSDVIVSVYIADKDGYTIMADRFADRKFKNSPNVPDSYEAQSRPWYQQAESSNELIFTDVVNDALGGGPCIICAMPYYRNGEFAGVVGMGSFLDNINRIITTTKIGETGFGFIMNDKGYIISSPHSTGDLIPNVNNPVDLRQSSNPSLAKAAEEILTNKHGITKINIDSKDYYIAYTPLQNAPWYFATVIEVNEVTAPAEKSSSQIINTAKIRIDNLNKQTKTSMLYMGLIILLLLLFITYIGWKFATYLTTPIKQLSDGVQKIAMGNLKHKLNIHTGDEIESLSISFNAMTEELQRHIKNLQKITTEKQRIATELNIATNIQQNMLPCIFPPYPDRHEFDIYAAMYPAKEVGGDFYDFYLLDENHLVITIADVSDKGIPAAMFMVITKTILKNFAMSMTSPDDFSAVVSCTNKQLCENNEEMMFVTVFMGMLDLKTGHFIYVNAGHTPPFIRHQNNKKSLFEHLPVEKNCVLGIRENADFIQQELYLKQNDELFFYTDGVTDTLNPEKQLYSAERLQNTLNSIEPSASCRSILKTVKSSLDDFAENTPQADDITMLIIKLNTLNK